MPDLVHPFFGQVEKALAGVLRGKGYCLVLSPSDDDPELEQEEIDQLLARRVDEKSEKSDPTLLFRAAKEYTALSALTFGRKSP